MLSSIDQNLLPPPDPSSPHVLLPSQVSNSPSPSPSSTSSSPSPQPRQQQQPVPSPEVELEADLPNPLPSFSIRDYVFTARSKDIKTNWPFSLKNLQLCLNHGLTEVLPPFQPPDTIRNLQSSSRSCTVKEPPTTTIVDKVNTSEFDHKKNDRLLEPSSDDTDTVVKLTEKQVDIISSLRLVEEDGNSFPSLITTTTTSDVESLPKTSLKASKKCRLIVKFGDRGVSADDIASATTTSTPIVSESSSMMASKVCPVCKTFSSSSNTTLNAHIDQCLAVESSSTPPKWTADDDDQSKVAKPHHRAKPRKTRLMIDIYKTAPRCTLEELDRRNGRLSSLAVEEIDEDETTYLEGKSERVKPVQADKHSGDVGPVYIDESGTKVRILSSKFDEVSPVVVRGVGESGGGMKKRNTKKKCLRGSKNMVAMKKKKSLVQKHKYLKLAAQSKKLFSYKTARSSQVRGNHEQLPNVRTFSDMELHASQQQITPDNSSGSLRPWVCSKPRGIPKKINNHHQEGHQQQQPPIRSQWHSPPVESDDQSFPGGDSSEESTGIKKFTNLSENLAFSHERIEKNKVQQEVSIRRKRGRPLSRRPVITGDEDVGKSFGAMKQKFVESNRDDRFDHSLKPSDACKSKMMESLDSSTDRSVEARKKKIKKGPNFKEPWVHVIDERRDELLADSYEVDKQHDLMHDHREYQLESDVATEEMACDDGNAMMESRQIDGMMICNNLRGKESLGVNSLDSVSPGFDSTRELVHGDDIVNVTLSKTSDGRHGGPSLSKSIDTVFYAAKDASKLSMEDYRGFLSGSEAPTDSAEPDFVNEHEMTTEMETEFDSEDAENGGRDCFPEVDPIPIPGPPGSFLPSPRDMGGSEDFQGNSSVTTTSRAQSSIDLGNVVDRDSSRSPISAASSISNSTTTAHNGCGLDFVESKRSLGSTTVASSDVEPLVQNGDGVLVSKPCIDRELNMRLDRNRLDKESLSVRNDDHHQPCCCQRKERLPLAPANIVLNQHDSSLLLRRRKMTASMTTDHPSGKSKDCSDSSVPRSSSTLDMRTEYAPPSSCPTSGSDNVGFQVVKPHVVIPSMDSESSSPSTPNPVLRLMGKNLMVASKDDEAPKPPFFQQQQQQFPSFHSQNHYPADPQFPRFAKTGNVWNLDPRPLHHMVSLPRHHTLVDFSGNPHGHQVSPYSNVGLANAAAVHLPNGMFLNYPPQCNPPATNAYSSPSPRCTKEVIIIDDGPERAHPVMGNKVMMKYGEGSSSRENNDHMLSSGSMYLPGGQQSNYSRPNHMHPIACYPPSQEHHHPPPFGESSPIVRGSRFHSTPSNFQWPAAASSGMLHQSPLQAAAAAPPPSSNGVLRSSSALYYSPSFS